MAFLASEDPREFEVLDAPVEFHLTPMQLTYLRERKWTTDAPYSGRLYARTLAAVISALSTADRTVILDATGCREQAHKTVAVAVELIRQHLRHIGAGYQFAVQKREFRFPNASRIIFATEREQVMGYGRECDVIFDEPTALEGCF